MTKSVDLFEAKLQALMVAGMGGNARAYETLLLLCADRLRSYFRRRLAGREADVEDLVQETLIAIDRKRATYIPALPFTAWLHGIARYRLIDMLRRDGRRAVSLDEGGHELSDAGNADALLAELDVMALLSSLPPKQAAAIRLTRIDGYSVREAAALTGQSEPSVKINVHRGLGRLVAAIKGES
jgi:RNA polymerase sigma factor (sigma-70 family)